MLDWSTSIIECDASHLKTGKIVRFKSDGEVDWECPSWENVPSHDTSIRIRPATPSIQMLDWANEFGRRCPSICLAFSGNPTKWLQRHNVAGPSILYHDELLKLLIGRLPYHFELSPVPSMQRGRMDIAEMFRIGEDCKAVHDWIHLAAAQSRSRHGTAILQGDTVYWGRGSRRWTMKAYCKYCELKKHKLPEDLNYYLSKYTHGLLRIELTLKGQELVKYVSYKDGVMVQPGDDIFWDYWRRLTMKNKMIVEDMFLDNLGRAAQNTYLRWQRGEDMRQRLPKPTFYRHRQEIYKVIGNDISLSYSPAGGSASREDIFSEEYLRQHQEPESPPELEQNKLLLKVG